MRIAVVIPILMLILSCGQHSISNEENLSASIRQETTPSPADSMFVNWDDSVYYFNHIKKYIENSLKVIPNKNCVADLNNIVYDKVVAYDFYGNHERYPIFLDGIFNYDNYRGNVYDQKALSQDQVNFITHHLSEKSTYGGETAACFEPSMAVIFFNHDTLVLEIDICLDCNYYSLSSPDKIDIDVELEIYDQFIDEDYGDTITLYKFGFSDEGAIGIAQLAKDLGLKYKTFKPSINNFDE
ncbi:MAG: hypothetical protein H6598_03685 [Flavobacteriales bacterium]|nr:hypothetical protein [Flavobacteriales bacterium]